MVEQDNSSHVRSTFPPLDHSRLGDDGLFLSILPNLLMQMGTCGHCAVLEKGRPDRASDAKEGGADFPQELFLALMTEYGVELSLIELYECP